MNVKLNNSKHTSMDLWTRPKDFLHNTVIVKKPINTTPLKLSKGNDTADMANMGRKLFLRSNPRVYVPDFDLADELQQQNMGQKVHLSDDTLDKLIQNSSLSKSGIFDLVSRLLSSQTKNRDPNTLMELLEEISKLDLKNQSKLWNDIQETKDTNAISTLTDIMNIINPPEDEPEDEFEPTGLPTQKDQKRNRRLEREEKQVEAKMRDMRHQRDERIALKELKAKEKKEYDKEREKGDVPVLSKKQKNKAKKNQHKKDTLFGSDEKNPFSALLNPDKERGVGRKFAKAINKVETKEFEIPIQPLIQSKATARRIFDWTDRQANSIRTTKGYLNLNGLKTIATRLGKDDPKLITILKRTSRPQILGYIEKRMKASDWGVVRQIINEQNISTTI